MKERRRNGWKGKGEERMQGRPKFSKRGNEMKSTKGPQIQLLITIDGERAPYNNTTLSFTEPSLSIYNYTLIDSKKK